MYYVGGFIFLMGGMFVSIVVMKRQVERDRAAVQALPYISGNPMVYFDVEDGDEPVGRIVFQLRKDVVPRAAENFRALCTGERGFGYRASPIYGVEKHARVFGGDFYGSGSGGYSIYGDTFADESHALTHMGPGTLAMRNYGPDTNNSQFYITLRSLPQYDGVSEVVGYVTEGFHVLEYLDKSSRSNGRFAPRHDFRIAASGELPPPSLPPAADTPPPEA